LRTITRRVLLGLGIVFLLIGLLAGYAQVVVISSTGFANTAVSTLDHQDVRSSLSTLIVNKLMANAPPRLQRAQPFLEQAVGTVIGSEEFKNLLRATAQRTHKLILSEHSNQVVINLSQQAAVVLGVLSRVNPQLAAKLKPAQQRLSNVGQNNPLVPVIRALDKVRIIEILAPIASVLCFLLAILLAIDRRHELHNVGIAIAVPAAIVWLLLVLLEVVGPSFVGGLLGQAFPGLVESLLGNLRRWSLVLATSGVILVAIAHSSGRPLELRALGERVRGWFTNESTGKFAILGIGGVAIGLLLIFEPLAVFRLALLVVGALAVYWAVFYLLQLMVPLQARVSTNAGTISEGAVGAGRWSAVAVVAVAVTLLWVKNIWTI
jgi:hypothetical protein